MPLVHANILKGRTQKAKAGFAKAVTDAAVEHLGVAPDHVRVLIHEVEPDSWFTAGAAKGPPG